MKAISRPLVASLRGRTYAAQAAAKQVEEKLTPQDVKVTKLPSGTVVASLENYSPISRVSVVYKAGSRQESPTNLGITHCLRAASNLSTAKSSAFAVVKNIQHIGGNLGCTSTREMVMYNLQCSRDVLDTGVEFLGHVSTQQEFRTWEVTGLKPRLEFDLAALAENYSAQVMEAVHKAAYRNSLGNSLFLKPHKLSQYSPDDLASFVASNYTADNMAVVGVGVDHDQLVDYTKHFTPAAGPSVPQNPATYQGGELRVDAPGPFVHAAMVTEGCSLTSSDLPALCLLQQILGSGPSAKFTDMLTLRLNKAVRAASSKPTTASSIMANYTDTGLFGFYVICHAADAEKALRAASSVCAEATKGSITEEDVVRGKHQLKALYLLYLEAGAQQVESLAEQTLLAGQFSSQNFQDLEKVTLADVNKVAKKVINGKPSMAVVGDLSSTPYLDKLL